MGVCGLRRFRVLKVDFPQKTPQLFSLSKEKEQRLMRRHSRDTLERLAKAKNATLEILSGRRASAAIPRAMARSLTQRTVSDI